MATMNNFRAEDMPSAAKKDAKPAEAKEEKKDAAPKKAAPKKEAVKKAAPKKDETVVPEPQNVPPTQTNTETHGVGPSTVEGGNTPAADEAEEDKN